jgi:hypothetical protein
VVVTRVTIREFSHIAADKSFSGTLPPWQFLLDFQPVAAALVPLTLPDTLAHNQSPSTQGTCV